MQALQDFIVKGNNIYFCIRKQDITMSKKEKIAVGIFVAVSVLIAANRMGGEKFFMYVGVAAVTVGLPLLIMYIKNR
jgi:hypothetical protein